MRWQPLEISFVAIPADPSAKVLRSQNNEYEAMITRSIPLRAPAETAVPSAPNIQTPAPDFSKICDEVREIGALVMHWQRTHPGVVELGEKAMKDKTTLQEFQRQLLTVVQTPAREDLSAPSIGAGQANPQRGARSLGMKFVESESYKKRRSIKGVSVDLPEYQFRTDYGMLTRVNFGIGTSDVSGSTDIGGTSGANIDQIKPFNLLNQQPLVIADLFSQGATAGDVVRYIRELTYTQAAARVAEAAGKWQAQLDIGVINATVEKTAVYLDVTEEMMNDWQQAASFINSRLSYMVQAKEDDYLLNGTGSSQITGVLQTSGIQTVSGAVNTVDQLLKAKAYVEGANGSGFAMPDAYVMNPLDWLSVRLTKDGNGQYLFGGPGYAPYGVGGYSNVGLMWGLPVVTSTFIAQGTALCGAFRAGGQIFRRQGLTIKTTDSDGSKFLSNIMTVLAESRFALAVYQPARFCSVTAIPAAA
jgi:HK97 family phage major capsid protein